MKRRTEFYSVADAKAKFSKVIEDSISEDIVITKNGKPVSVVMNYNTYSKIFEFLDKVWDLYLLDIGDPSLFKQLKLEDIFGEDSNITRDEGEV
jgi:prevent-host-death family protein